MRSPCSCITPLPRAGASHDTRTTLLCVRQGGLHIADTRPVSRQGHRTFFERSSLPAWREHELAGTKSAQTRLSVSRSKLCLWLSSDPAQRVEV